MEYKTIKTEHIAEFTVKKSRFIGHISPVTNEEQAIIFINKISKKHHSASHNVYAYQLRQAQIRRYSDDGEPQGTAGIPVLDVIVKENITDVCIVATRYFGGIMLGGGGLVRAYSQTARAVINSSHILHMVYCKYVSFNLDYHMYGKIISIFDKFSIKIVKTEFLDSIFIEIIIISNEYDNFVKHIHHVFSGQLKSTIRTEEFYPLENFL